MRIVSLIKAARDKVAPRLAFGFRHEENARGPRGDVFFTLEHRDGRVEKRSVRNVITKDFSILMARLAKDPLEPGHGVYALAVGEGAAGWDIQNPEAATPDQRSLHNEIGRKTFSETAFIDNGGNPVDRPTNVVDFTAIFGENEAVGPIVEMGLVGGDANDNTTIRNPIEPPAGTYDPDTDVEGKDILCNYLTFPVINKPATARLQIVWRLTF